MVALRSLDPEERADVLAELRKTVEDRERYERNLARLELQRAPHSYRGTLRAQIAACKRYEARYLRLLEEVAA